MNYSYHGPIRSNGWIRYTDSHLNPLDDGAYQLLDRRMMALSAALGIVAGLVVFGLIVWALTRRSWYRMQLVFGLILGVLVGAPLGIGVSMLDFGLFGPSQTYGKYYDAQGKTITEEAYVLAERQTIANTSLLGVGTGVLIALAVALLYQRRYGQRATEARQRLRSSVKRLETSFSEVVSSQGGAEALLQRGRVGELLNAVEARS